ncbi:MAG TPA: 4Fe-4S binding protein [Tepidisphaeraceae bacterium]|jgi:NAD-dependent dihydropyrimidine dehydrogenase PreA subunit
MPAIVDTEKCTGCKSCEEACPNGAVAVPDKYAVVQIDECIDCSACVDACVDHAIALED